MKLEQIDWIKEQEEEEELKEWLETNKTANPEWRPLSHSPKNWWKMQPLDPEEEEYNLKKYINIVFRGVMKKLNR